MTDLAHGNVECGLGLSKTRWHMHAVDVAVTNFYCDKNGVVDEDYDANDIISRVQWQPVKAFAEDHPIEGSIKNHSHSH